MLHSSINYVKLGYVWYPFQIFVFILVLWIQLKNTFGRLNSKINYKIERIQIHLTLCKIENVLKVFWNELQFKPKNIFQNKSQTSPTSLLSINISQSYLNSPLSLSLFTALSSPWLLLLFQPQPINCAQDSLSSSFLSRSTSHISLWLCLTSLVCLSLCPKLVVALCLLILLLNLDRCSRFLCFIFAPSLRTCCNLLHRLLQSARLPQPISWLHLCSISRWYYSLIFLFQ